MKFAPMHEAFQSCCYGNDWPDEVHCTQAFAEALRAQIFVSSLLTVPLEQLRFNGAKVIIDPAMAVNEIEFRNTQHPLNPNYNRKFIIEDW